MRAYLGLAAAVGRRRAARPHRDALLRAAARRLDNQGRGRCECDRRQAWPRAPHAHVGGAHEQRGEWHHRGRGLQGAGGRHGEVGEEERRGVQEVGEGGQAVGSQVEVEAHLWLGLGLGVRSRDKLDEVEAHPGVAAQEEVDSEEEQHHGTPVRVRVRVRVRRVRVSGGSRVRVSRVRVSRVRVSTAHSRRDSRRGFGAQRRRRWTQHDSESAALRA
eukprot:scaffold42334_cov65-Phaeocystis_antarctica.AAC.5